MAGKIHMDIVTPERLLISDEVDEVIAPGAEGEFGVLPGHCHFLTTLRIGELRYRKGEEWKRLSVSWGYAQVEPKRVTILAEIAERAEEIDLARAEAAAKSAEQQLAAASKSEEMEAARAQLEKALLRLKVGKKQ
ncbi:MAG TPA: F0F1 ATP synthase subunit epsilon [Nitrospiria bacterium]|nr:F0F1 ATP synthase subunit epsilon [Nitrospiria bacterium]